MTKKNIAILLWSALIAAILILASNYVIYVNPIHLKIYDTLVAVRGKFIHPPKGIEDVVLVKIDNDTLNNLPERWPYSRATFAKVIDRLKAAGARTIGLDFVFYGLSSDDADALLEKAFENAGNIVTGSTLDENGALNVPAYRTPAEKTASGIVTKFEDSDKIIRRNLTYLITGRTRQKTVLSWELELLKIEKRIDLSTLSDAAHRVVFLRNQADETWEIPVDPKTGTFLINFKAHTTDFRGLSFYRVLKGDFNADEIKNKIVLIGFTSLVLGDIHDTPLGWIPGMTLSANAFLTLYSHDFLKEMPKEIETIFVLIGALVASLFVLFLSSQRAFFCLIAEIALFFIASVILLSWGITWDYSLFPLATIISASLSKKMMDKIN